METVYQILGLVGAILIVLFLYKSIKNRPEVFSKGNLSKSLFTMGVLGLGLIVFVAFLVFLVRQ